MSKKIIVLSSSPKKDGNTATLVKWFSESARSRGADVEIIETAGLRYKANGCTSCRACQRSDLYECVINDDAKPVLAKMALADVIVMATPLYFWSASAQLKLMVDRMFSLYKWNNDANTMETPLKGKTLVLIASSYDPEGLDILEKPFIEIAKYSGMQYDSLLVPNAGVSGTLKEKEDVKNKAFRLGERI